MCKIFFWWFRQVFIKYLSCFVSLEFECKYYIAHFHLALVFEGNENSDLLKCFGLTETLKQTSGVSEAVVYFMLVSSKSFLGFRVTRRSARFYIVHLWFWDWNKAVSHPGNSSSKNGKDDAFHRFKTRHGTCSNILP